MKPTLVKKSILMFVDQYNFISGMSTNTKTPFIINNSTNFVANIEVILEEDQAKPIDYLFTAFMAFVNLQKKNVLMFLLQ